MPARIWILPTSAVVIAGLCIYKWTRNDQPFDATTSSEATCSATTFKFELFDQKMRRVRLERYLGRHRILLVFFDGKIGAERDPVLVQLRERYSAVKKKGIIVLGVSTLVSQFNKPDIRPAGARPSSIYPKRPFPFELLSDFEQASPIHRLWGRYDKRNQRPTTGTFLIDRAGRVTCDGGIPKPLPDPQKTIDELLAE